MPKLPVIGKVVCIGSLGLLIIAAFFLIALHLPFLQNRLFRSLSARVQTSSGILLEASDFRFNLLTGNAQGHNLKVRSAQAPDMPPLAEIHSITLQFHPWQLLKGLRAFTDIRAEDPKIQIVISADGKSNLPVSKSSAPFDWSSLPENISLKNASWRFQDARRSLDLQLPGLELTLKGNPDARVLSLAALKEGVLQFRQRSLPIQGMQFQGLLNAANLEIQNMEIHSGSNSLKVHGRVRNLNDPDFQLEMVTQLSLAEVSRLIHGNDSISGGLSVSALISGPVKEFTASIETEFTSILFPPWDPVSGTALWQYQHASHDVALKDLQAHSALGQITASGSLTFKNQESAGRLTARLQNLKLGRTLEGIAGDPGLAARVSGPVSIAWKNMDWNTSTGQAQLQLSAPNAREAADAFPLNGSAVVTWDRSGLRFHTPSLSGPGIHMTADLRSNRSLQTLNGDWNGEIRDAALFLPAARHVWPQEMSFISTPVGGALQWSAQLDGILRAPGIAGVIHSTNFDLGSIQGLGFDIPLEYRDEKLRIHESAISWRNQTARFSGMLNFAPADSTEYELQADLNNAAVSELFSQPEFKGGFSAHLSGQGSLAHPELEASLQGSGLSAFEEPLGPLHASVRLSGKRLTLSSLRMEKPQIGNPGILEASGTLDWDSDTLDLQIRGDALHIDSLQLPGQRPLRGILSLEATASGSPSNPSWSVRLNGQSISLADQNIGDIEGSIEGKGIHSAVNLESSTYGATLRGDLDVAPPYSALLTLEAAGFDFSRLHISLPDGTPVKGSATMHIETRGELAHPEESAARISITNLNLGTADYRIQSKSNLDAEWKNQTLSIPFASLESEAGAWTISGSMPLSKGDPPGKFTIQGALPLSLLVHMIPSAREVQIKGLVEVQGSLTGALEDIRPEIMITTADGELRIPDIQIPFTGITIDAEADSEGITVRRLEAVLGGGSIRAHGSFPFQLLSGAKAAKPMRAEVELLNMNPAAMADISEEFRGSIGMRAVVEADRTDLRSLHGDIEFTELKLAQGKAEAEQDGATHLIIADGRIAIDHWTMKGTGNASLRSTGWFSILEDGGIDLQFDGSLDAEMLSAGKKDYGLDGLINLKLAVRGSRKDIRMNGMADLRGGRFFLAAPQLLISDLLVHAEFSDNLITLTTLSGQANGGSLNGAGSARISKMALADVSMQVAAENIFFEYPKGLRTISNLKLELRSQEDSYLISGSGNVLQGVYREAIALETLQQESTPPPSERSSLPERIRFNVLFQTEGPLAVDNNLARLEAYADLRLIGTVRQPVLLGRLEFDEGGRVFVSERTFTIARAVVTFNNEQRIEPLLDLQATTRIGEYLITFNANGGLKDMVASFSSDPAASEDQIQSILLTGSPDNTDRISSGALASRSALSLFGSTVVGGLNMRVRQALGFSDFRIEPSLISADSDPTARLTVGQNLTPELSLTYSTNLRDNNDQIWIVEYDWRRNLTARYLNRSNDTDRTEIRHRIRLGGGPDTGDLRTVQRKEKDRIKSVQIIGDAVFPESAVLKEINLEANSRFDAIDIQKKIEKLTRFYRNQGYLEATIRQERVKEQNQIALSLIIDAGPQVSFLFEGEKVPQSIGKDVARAWQAGIVDNERLRATSDLIRKHFFRNRFCDAQITAMVKAPSNTQKVVQFTILPGLHYEQVLVEFPGLVPALNRNLRRAVEDFDLELAVLGDPVNVQFILASHLRDRGYLTPDIATPSVRRDRQKKSYTSIIPVQAGPRYRLGEIGFEGNKNVPPADLLKEMDLRSGEPYTPAQLGRLLQAVGAVYWRKGYRNATIDAREQTVRGSGQVNLLFTVQENRRAVIGDIQVAGNVKTDTDFLMKRIPFQKGDVVDGDKVDLLRRRLTGSGAYNSVDITLTPSEIPPPQTDTQSLNLAVRVREPKPFSLEYGGSYDTERKLGLVADISSRNLLGEARILGYRVAGDQDRVDQRVYFTQAFLRGYDIATNTDLSQENSIIDSLTILKRSFTIQQQVEFRRKFTFSYGYRIQHTKTRFNDPKSTEPDSSSTTSPLLASLSRDTRDDIFDATRGSYISQSFEYGPTFLGGDLPYYRYFGQYFKYFGLTPPAEVAFSDARRPRFVFATGVRLGLMDALEDRDITPGDRFFGGGSTSIRGFKQNSLGPQIDGQAVGGQATLIWNNELRTPLYKWLETAAFLDIGNVFEKPSDIGISGLRKSAGIGLRIRNPFVLIRLDYGWKLDRISGESRGAFHFGIGQAF